MSNQNGRLDLDKLYRVGQSVEGLPALTPWDIGGPLPVAQELVAYGALPGTVLAPGTGPYTTRCFTRRGFCRHRHRRFTRGYRARCQERRRGSPSGLLLDGFKAVEPLLQHHRVHLPFWAVHASRLD
jgi:hypothetical protein